MFRILEALDDHNNFDPAGAGAGLGNRITKYEEYCQGLAPLVELEDRLTRLLVPPGEDGPTDPVLPLTITAADGHDSRSREVAVRPNGWKRIFQKNFESKFKRPKTPKSVIIERWWGDPDDPVHALQPCAKVMQELWADPEVKQKLHEKQFRLEESSELWVIVWFDTI